MITRLANSSLAQDLPKYRSMLAGNAAYDPGAFVSIASATGSGATSVTFSSIPSDYQHLQIRCSFLINGESLYLRANSDTGSNYARHGLYGNGTSASAFGSVTQDYINITGVSFSGDTTNPATAIVDIHDYASTSKNKTIRVFSGKDANGSGAVNLFSGLWLSTSAITSINLVTLGATNFTTGSTFALYGVKGA